jgi:hypothetical protein
VGEVFVDGEGGAGFADAAPGLRAEDESFHGIPFGLKFIPAGGGLLAVGWRKRCGGSADGNVACPQQRFGRFCRGLAALQLHPEFLDLGAMLAAEPRYAEDRGFHPNFLQHGHDLVVGSVLGPEQNHAAFVLVEHATACRTRIKRFCEMKQGLFAVFRTFGRLFIGFTLHVPFIAHPRMNRKVSFGGLWDARFIDRCSGASSAHYPTVHSCHMCAARVLGRVLSQPRDCAGYKRNVRAKCVLGSMRLIKLGETPDYFHHSILAMNHGLKLSDEKYEAG